MSPTPLAAWLGLFCWIEPGYITMMSLEVNLFTISQVHLVPWYSDATKLHVLRVWSAPRGTNHTRETSG